MGVTVGMANSDGRDSRCGYSDGRDSGCGYLWFVLQWVWFFVGELAECSYLCWAH